MQKRALTAHLQPYSSNKKSVLFFLWVDRRYREWRSVKQTWVSLTCDEVLDEPTFISLPTFQQAGNCRWFQLGWTGGHLKGGGGWENWERCSVEYMFQVKMVTGSRWSISGDSSNGCVLWPFRRSEEILLCLKSRLSDTVSLSSFTSLLNRMHSCSLASNSSCKSFICKHTYITEVRYMYNALRWITNWNKCNIKVMCCIKLNCTPNVTAMTADTCDRAPEE